MSKLFSFDFDADDIDDSNSVEESADSQHVPKDIANLVPPKNYSLQDMVGTLNLSIMSFTPSLCF